MMLRKNGIGIDAVDWRLVVSLVNRTNEAITERLEPTISQNHFTALSSMLEYLEEVNRLVARYQEIVSTDVKRLNALEERIRFREQELRRLFFKTA